MIARNMTRFCCDTNREKRDDKHDTFREEFCVVDRDDGIRYRDLMSCFRNPDRIS